jgi:hypothetical protein
MGFTAVFTKYLLLMGKITQFCFGKRRSWYTAMFRRIEKFNITVDSYAYQKNPYATNFRLSLDNPFVKLFNSSDYNQNKDKVDGKIQIFFSKTSLSQNIIVIRRIYWSHLNVMGKNKPWSIFFYSQSRLKLVNRLRKSRQKISICLAVEWQIGKQIDLWMVERSNDLIWSPPIELMSTSCTLCEKINS